MNTPKTCPNCGRPLYYLAKGGECQECRADRGFAIRCIIRKWRPPYLTAKELVDKIADDVGVSISAKTVEYHIAQMKRAASCAAVLLALLLTGCAGSSPTPAPTPAPQTASAPLPPPALLALPGRTNRVGPPITRDHYLPYVYPKDASNYLWDEQESTNRINWVTVRSNLTWPPSTNSDRVVYSSNAQIYFSRMVGHRP